jgi:DNA-binding PadR family transcriptional regulator
VTIKQLLQSVQAKDRPKNVMQALKDLEARGEIMVSDRVHKKFKDKKVRVYAVTPSEELIQ